MAAGSNPRPRPQVVALQIGSELRITQHGDIRLSNPTVEVENAAADAVISIYHDPETHEHVIRLIDPVVQRSER